MYPRPVSSSNTFLFFSFFANVVVSLISINQGATQFGVFPGGCFLVASAHFWHLSHRQSLDNWRVRQLSWRVMRSMLGIGGWLIDCDWRVMRGMFGILGGWLIDSVVKDWRVMRGVLGIVLGIGGWLIYSVVKDNFNGYVFSNFISGFCAFLVLFAFLILRVTSFALFYDSVFFTLSQRETNFHRSQNLTKNGQEPPQNGQIFKNRLSCEKWLSGDQEALLTTTRPLFTT